VAVYKDRLVDVERHPPDPKHGVEHAGRTISRARQASPLPRTPRMPLRNRESQRQCTQRAEVAHPARMGNPHEEPSGESVQSKLPIELPVSTTKSGALDAPRCISRCA